MAIILMKENVKVKTLQKVACDKKCIDCGTEGCLECKEDYYIDDVTGSCVCIITLILACDENPLKCNTPGEEIKCMSGFYFTGSYCESISFIDYRMHF